MKARTLEIAAESRKPVFATAFAKGESGESTEEAALSEVAIRAQLERVIASVEFCRSPRLVRFLRVVVEGALSGATVALKEYNLGADVFDKGSQFDPSADSIVRVQARRLRLKLRAYYLSRGSADSIVIDLHAGSYVPRFYRRPPLLRDNLRPAGAACGAPSLARSQDAAPAMRGCDVGPLRGDFRETHSGSSDHNPSLARERFDRAVAGMRRRGIDNAEVAAALLLAAELLELLANAVG